MKSGIDIVNIQSNVPRDTNTSKVKLQNQTGDVRQNFENILKESISDASKAKSVSKADKTVKDTRPSDEEEAKNKKVDKNKGPENKLATAEAVIKKSIKENTQLLKKMEITNNAPSDSKEKAKKILFDAASDVADIYAWFNNAVKNEKVLDASNNLTQNEKLVFDKITEEIKDGLKLIKDAGSLKDLKDALAKLDKITKSPAFKEFLKLVKDNNGPAIPEFKELIAKLPTLTEKLDKIIKNFKSNLNVLGDITIKFVKEKLSEFRSDDSQAVRAFRTKMHYENRYAKGTKSHNQNSGNSNGRQEGKNSEGSAQVKTSDNSNISFNQNQSIQQRTENSFYKGIQNAPANQLGQNYSPKDIFNQIAKNIKFSATEGKKELWVHIEPPELGKVKVNLILENGKVHAKFGVENKNVKEILEQFKGDIIKQLEQGGLRVDSVDIDLNSGSQDSGAGKKYLNQLERIANRMSASQKSLPEDDAATRLMSSSEYYGSSLMPSWLASEVNVTI